MSDSTKTVIVTGGVGGLGSVMCEKFAEAGNRVYALDLDKEKGESMEVRMREKGYDFSFIQMDLTSEEDWAKAVASIVRNVNSIDVLINNAGINIRKPIEEMNIDEWNTMMRVNTGSVFLGCKYVIPVMKEQHDGVIINMSSVCGLVGHKYTPEAYTASKGAVTMLTKAVASRYAQFGI
ncbi:MAG: SDR family NAD(P)-dependent oxidoreductase, partial [Sphaerochaetaceae bacterium]